MSKRHEGSKMLIAATSVVQAIGQVSALHTGTTVSYDIEPFTRYGQHATDSAFPHGDSLLPVGLSVADRLLASISHTHV